MGLRNWLLVTNLYVSIHILLLVTIQSYSIFAENLGFFKSAPKVWNRLAICAMHHVTYVFFVLFICQVKPQERLSLDACISHSWISTVGGGSLSKILKSLGISSF